MYMRPMITIFSLVSIGKEKVEGSMNYITIDMKFSKNFDVKVRW